MTEERLKLWEKAEKTIDAYIDTLSQDKGGLADKLKQEDVKDFLVSLWVDCSTEATKKLQEELKIQKHNTRTVAYLGECIEDIQDKKIAELEAQLEREKNLSQCRLDHNEQLREMIKKLKQDLDNARENANKQEQWEIYSVLNDIYNDNFEVITSVSN